MDAAQEAADQQAYATGVIQQGVVTPRLLVAAIEHGWWDPMAEPSGSMPDAPDAIDGTPTIVELVDAATWAGLALGDPRDRAGGSGLRPRPGRRRAPGERPGGRVCRAGRLRPWSVLRCRHRADPRDGGRELLALGVAPAFRRQGLATELLRRHATSPSDAHVTVAERDVVDPLPRETRSAIARRLLESAGFDVDTAAEPVRSFDPGAITAHRS